MNWVEKTKTLSWVVVQMQNVKPLSRCCSERGNGMETVF